MLGKLAVLCLCLALASAKPARSVRFNPRHFGLVRTCDTDGLIEAAESIATQTETFALNMATEIAKIQTDVALCSNPISILLCATKGISGILNNAKLIVTNVKEYMTDMSTEVPALITQVKACL